MFVLLLVGAAQAQTNILVTYDAGTNGSAPDPQTLGWTRSGSGGTDSGVSPDSAFGVNAWNVNDALSTAIGFTYSTNLSAAQTAAATTNGWEFRAKLRMVAGYSGTESIYLQYNNAAVRWLYFLDVTAGGALTVRVFNNGYGANQTFTVQPVHDGNYHELVLTKSPDTNNAILKLDDTFVCLIGTSAANATYGVAFGAGSTGGDGSANFNRVSFATLPPVINLPRIVSDVSGDTLTLSWPSNYLRWVLQTQTNNLGAGLSTNWSDVPGSGSVTNLIMTINAGNPSVFYRLRDPALLVFQEDWSSGSIDPAKWYMLRKKWGTGNNGVTPTNVWIGSDNVNGTQQNVLVCEAHGDQYTGPVTGYGGQTTRVGGVIVTKEFFASGRYEVVMKVGVPSGQTAPIGSVPAIWNYSYDWVQTTVANQDNFDPNVPLYNPLLKIPGSPATEYWSEIDYPELGKNGDFANGLYNTWCQNKMDGQVFAVPNVMDGQYHTYVMEWRTGLKPMTNVTDSQVIQYNGYWWVQSTNIPIASYLGNPLKRLGPNSYAAYTGLTTMNWLDGVPLGGNTNYVPCMASQLTMGVWLPGWGGVAPWQTAQISFGSVKIWQYDDPGDVRGILTEDVPPNF